MQNVNTNEQPSSNPNAVDYATLGADVAAWRDGFLQHLAEEYGQAEADRTAARLKAAPWLELQWYVEDRIPAAQAAYATSAPDMAEPTNPQYQMLEVDGRNFIGGNADAGIDMVMKMDTPEAGEFLEIYRRSLYELSMLNLDGKADPEGLRAEAFQMARRAAGASIEPAGTPQ